MIRRLFKTNHGRDESLECGITPDQIGAGNWFCRSRVKAIAIIAQENSADAAKALGHKDGSERTFSHSEPDDPPCAAGAVVEEGMPNTPFEVS